jgi:hypothetical protein
MLLNNLKKNMNIKQLSLQYTLLGTKLQFLNPSQQTPKCLPVSAVNGLIPTLHPYKIKP